MNFEDLTFGFQFRAAHKAAEEIGAQIVLGDRPIEITVSSQTWNLESL
jgi:pheromone shutdown protein TraB